jgi:asparagine synthase (glutamine-hydrolysing)
MCGIAGILDWQGTTPGHMQARLQVMADRLQHRGPDGQGFYIQGPLGLAHTRLSIIDLQGGEQPIHNEDRSIQVIFNGEIFNYIELRESLQSQGHRFYTHSDTEVIVHLYEQYGDQFVGHLNGQFAIALWDARRERLLLVRDRVGIAPLFYTRKDQRLVFASEIKAILPQASGSPRLNAQALDQLLTFWSPVSPNTLFEGIFELAPGTMLVVDRSGEQLHRYWDWEFPASDDAYWQGDESSLAEELRELLIDATRLRLRADVPVGAYLSGGLDSSILASLIHHHSDAPLRTFSIGFDDPALDEQRYQRLLIDHLGARHSSIQCSTADIGNQFEDTIWHTETAILRTAPVPMKILSSLVRGQNYKVVLTGEGADEVFGGYDIFKEAKIRRFWAQQPDSAWRHRLLERLYPWLDLPRGQAPAFVRNFYGQGLDDPQLPWFSHLPRWDTTSRAKLFYTQDLQQQLRDSAVDTLAASLPSGIGRWHPFNRGQYIEAKSLMAGYLLCSQGDRMLMANSVEGRFPFLDHRVIEFANRLQPRLKMRVLNEKYLLKQALKQYIPPSIIERHKQPYRAPDIPALMEADGKRPLPFVADLLSADTLGRYGYFDAKKVGLLLRKATRGSAVSFKDNQALVAIVATQSWHRQFIERHQSFEQLESNRTL